MARNGDIVVRDWARITGETSVAAVVCAGFFIVGIVKPDAGFWWPAALVGAVWAIWNAIVLSFGIKFRPAGMMTYPAGLWRRTIDLKSLHDANSEIQLVVGLPNRTVYWAHLAGDFGLRKVRFGTVDSRLRFYGVLRQVAPHVRITSGQEPLPGLDSRSG